jgi:hypothetical protein
VNARERRVPSGVGRAVVRLPHVCGLAGLARFVSACCNKVFAFENCGDDYCCSERNKLEDYEYIMHLFVQCL